MKTIITAAIIAIVSSTAAFAGNNNVVIAKPNGNTQMTTINKKNGVIKSGNTRVANLVTQKELNNKVKQINKRIKDNKGQAGAKGDQGVQGLEGVSGLSLVAATSTFYGDGFGIGVSTGTYGLDVSIAAGFAVGYNSRVVLAVTHEGAGRTVGSAGIGWSF